MSEQLAKAAAESVAGKRAVSVVTEVRVVRKADGSVADILVGKACLLLPADAMLGEHVAWGLAEDSPLQAGL